MADSPTSVTPQSTPAISDPAMDTNQYYEHESERPQQVSPDSDIQLAQNEPPQIGPDTHDIVQMPSGHTVALPKTMPEAQKSSALKSFWGELTNASNAVKNAASNAAQAVGLPGDMPEWQAKEDAFMRDPIGEAGNAVGALLHGFNTQLGQIAPLSDDNKALVQRATDQYKQGNTLAAAVTLVPLVGDNLAKAVVQAKKHDFSGSLGTSVGTALPFLTGTEEEPLPISKEKPVTPTTTSYVHTPDQTGQFGNLEHAVTTKDLSGNTVGHLAAQDTAPGEVTVRSNQIYDAAHQGQGKGTSQLRTLVNETAKNPAIKTIHSDVSTTGAARGAWDKLVMENPDVVTKENIKGTPRYSVDLDKVREQAANAPEFNGVERRGSARSAPMGATDLEQAMKTPGQRIQTPFDVTEGAMDTINKDIENRLKPEEMEGPKPPKARAASAPTQSVGAASINDLNTKEDVPPFYSKAEQAIGEKVSNNSTPEQIKAVLKNAGVKDDEIKWSGLDDYLQGKTKVSKADLQQYIAEHKLSVQDVDLGKEQRYNLTPNEEETQHAGEPMFNVTDPQNGLTRFTGTEHAAHDYMSELGQGLNGDELHEMRSLDDEVSRRNFEDTQRLVGNLKSAKEELNKAKESNNQDSVVEAFKKVMEAENAIDRHEPSAYLRIKESRLKDLKEKSQRGSVNRPPQYGNSEGLGGGNGDWTVPGPKRNYQEKLLTLPSQTPVLPEETKLADFQNKLTNKYGSIENARVNMSDEERTQGRVLTVAAREARYITPKSEHDYVAPHFQKGEQQPNIVAHVRFSDRDAVNGKKTLFLEEAQSDWHSAGRHEGYQGDPKVIDRANQNIKAAEDERTAHVQSVLDRVNKLREETPEKGAIEHDASERIIPFSLRDEMTPEELKKYADLQDKVRQEENVKRALKQGKVPDAPFKQNWHELAIKRMLRHAAENGYDQLAWPTGKQQADLYGLENHFSRLEYDPENGELTGYDPEGHQNFNEKVDEDEKSLAEYMGPEAAAKMAEKIQEYHDNNPGEPDPDWFREHVAEEYDTEEREVPDENHEFDPTPEREEFDDFVKELAEKNGLNPKHVVWNDLMLHITPEEKVKGEALLEAAQKAEEEQEAERPTQTQHYVTRHGEDISGPHDTERDARKDMENRIQRDVEYEMNNYEPDRPETPTLENLDLVHGGEFHKLLYDQMIPSFLKKYAKKWGAEVGTTDIKNMGEPGTPEYQGPDRSQAEVANVLDHGGLKPNQQKRLAEILNYMKYQGVSLKEAMTAHKPGPIMHFLAEKLGGKIEYGTPKATVHAIPITPEMKKSVMKQGQPIAKAQPPDRKKIFGDLSTALA